MRTNFSFYVYWFCSTYIYPSINQPIHQSINFKVCYKFHNVFIQINSHFIFQILLLSEIAGKIISMYICLSCFPTHLICLDVWILKYDNNKNSLVYFINFNFFFFCYRWYCCHHKATHLCWQCHFLHLTCMFLISPTFPLFVVKSSILSYSLYVPCMCVCVCEK